MSHSGAVISTYYYLRDAQGNEMCRYVKYTNTTSQLMYVAEEHSIYGSSRVGLDNLKDTLYLGAVYTTTWGGVGASRRELGLKSFELANHLGNILVTVSDKPIYKVSSGTEIINATTDNIKLGDIVGGKTNYRDASGHVEIVTGIDPISGKITSTRAGSKKIRSSIFVQNVLEEKIWSDHIYSPFAVRRLK